MRSNVIERVVLIEQGPFRNPARGQIDRDGLRRLLTLARGGPVNCTWDHDGPNLGYFVNARLTSCELIADLYLSRRAPPHLVERVHILAGDECTRYGCSLELASLEIPDRDPRCGPVWLPRQLYSVAIVGQAEATSYFVLPRWARQQDLRAAYPSGTLSGVAPRIETMVPAPGGAMTVREIYERGSRRRRPRFISPGGLEYVNSGSSSFV